MGEANSTADSHGGGDYTGLSFGGVSTVAGNEATGMAQAMNGVTAAEPDLQVNSVVTSSSADGVSSVLSTMNGLSAHTGGSADQDGNGNPVQVCAAHHRSDWYRGADRRFELCPGCARRYGWHGAGAANCF